jgi:hypothetical protein
MKAIAPRTNGTHIEGTAAAPVAGRLGGVDGGGVAGLTVAVDTTVVVTAGVIVGVTVIVGVMVIAGVVVIIMVAVTVACCCISRSWKPAARTSPFAGAAILASCTA